MSRDVWDKLYMQILSSFKQFIAVMDCNPSMEHSTLLSKLGIKVNKVKRQLTKQLRKVERCELQLHANSEYDGAGSTIPICDQMQWIPIVEYKTPMSGGNLYNLLLEDIQTTKWTCLLLQQGRGDTNRLESNSGWTCLGKSDSVVIMRCSYHDR